MPDNRLGQQNLPAALAFVSVPCSALDLTVANFPKPTRPASFRAHPAESGPPPVSCRPMGLNYFFTGKYFLAIEATTT